MANPNPLYFEQDYADESRFRRLVAPQSYFGGGPGTDPSETIIGRVLTFLYFVFFITMPIWTKLDRTRPVPERVTMHD